MALWLQILILEIRRVARGWRWRGVLLAAALGAFWWRRDGFIPGNPIFFPLGNTGILGFTALWVGAAALLGTDALGQIRRSKAGRLFDTRPAPGISLAASRWAAAALLLSLGAAGFLVEIIVLRKMMQEPCSWPPLAALWFFWWIPLISIGVSLGLAARSWIRNDAAALSAALVLTLVLGWVFWRLLMPIEFFQSYAPHLGILLPLRFWAIDFLRILLLAWAIAVLGALGQRAWMPKRAVQIQPPYKSKAFSTFRRLLFPVWQVRHADNPTRAAAFSGLILAGAIGWQYRAEWIFRADSPAFIASWRQDAAPLPPELAQRKMPAWRVKDILAELDDRGAKPVMRFTLRAANSTTATLSRGAFALSPALNIEPGGGAPDGLENGPIPNTYLFNWAPPFDPGTTRTLVIGARPRKGAARIHAWARHPAFSDFNRLGDWIPRPCGFDILDRKAIIPLRPFRAAAVWRSNEFNDSSSSTNAPDGPSPGSFAPVLGAAIPLRIDGGWRMESPMPSPFISLSASRYEIAEKSFEGFSVRFLVFPRHAELADFLLDNYEPRYLKLRRALGRPAFPFVFNESPGASAAFSDMSLHSGKLDALDELIEDYEASRRDAFQIFNTQYREFLLSFLRTWARAAIPEADEPFLLRDSLVEYLYEFGFDRGSELPKEIARERVQSLQPFTPWVGRKSGELPFDFRDSDAPALNRRYSEEDLRGGDTGNSSAPRRMDIARRRALAFHHIIRYHLGDDRYSAFLKSIFSARVPFSGGRAEFLTQAITFQDKTQKSDEANTNTYSLRAAANQILDRAQLPILEVSRARVWLDQNPKNRTIEYTAEFNAANRGAGRWLVPVLLSTEDGMIERRIILGPGEKRGMTIKSRARPIAISIDPYGWLPQIPPFNAKAKRSQHSSIFLKNIQQRENP